jgi:hypothetical protein
MKQIRLENPLSRLWYFTGELASIMGERNHEANSLRKSPLPPMVFYR